MPRYSLVHILRSTYCRFCPVGQILPKGIGSKHVLSVAWIYGRLHQIPDLCAVEFLFASPANPRCKGGPGLMQRTCIESPGFPEGFVVDVWSH